MGRWLAMAGLIFAGVFAYRNTFCVPFLFDDDPAIFNNPTIRRLWPPWGMLLPPAKGAPVTGRPVVNISLALNYALGGFNVAGYHVFNLAVHLLAGLVLFAIVRRTLLQPVLRDRYGAAALPLAWLATLCWLVHPLLTEPVTYVVGRAEVLMGLFYLSTIYAALRAMGSERPRPWQGAAVAACLAGMATKEVMVTAPLMTLLYDRTFVAGSFRAAWTKRRNFYFALAATWGLLAGLMVSAGGTRGGSTGFTGRISWWEYGLTQFTAIVRYLKLSVFPRPLVFDYGTYLATNLFVVIPCGVLIVGLALATAWALWRRPAAGFLGAWFFAILAPTSSVVPVVTQTLAERRMYLALPVVMIAVVLGFYRGLRKWYFPVGLAIAATGMVMTAARNHDFRSARSIWEDTVAKRAAEPRPHLNLGFALMSTPATAPQAVEQFQEVLRLQPDFEMAYCCLGSALSLIPGRAADAESAFRQDLQLRPQSALGHLNFGVFLGKLPRREQEAVTQLRTAFRLARNDVVIQAQALAALGSVQVKLPGQRSEGIANLRQAIELFPDLADVHAALGLARAQETGGTAEALLELGVAQKLKPESAEIRIDRATVLAAMPDRKGEALADYESAIQIDPNAWQAHYDLGKLMLGIPNRRADGLAQLETAGRLAPAVAEVHTTLGIAAAGVPGRTDEAVREFETAVRVNPQAEDARINLATVLAQLPGRQAAAAEQFRAALRLNPNDADAHYRLACSLSGLAGQTDDAVGEFEQALRLKPDWTDADYNIAALLQSSPTRRPEAIRHLQVVLKQAPDDAAARTLLAKLNAQP